MEIARFHSCSCLACACLQKKGIITATPSQPVRNLPHARNCFILPACIGEARCLLFNEKRQPFQTFWLPLEGFGGKCFLDPWHQQRVASASVCKAGETGPPFVYLSSLILRGLFRDCRLLAENPREHLLWPLVSMDQAIAALSSMNHLGHSWYPQQKL